MPLFAKLDAREGPPMLEALLWRERGCGQIIMILTSVLIALACVFQSFQKCLILCNVPLVGPRPPAWLRPHTYVDGIL